MRADEIRTFAAGYQGGRLGNVLAAREAARPVASTRILFGAVGLALAVTGVIVARSGIDPYIGLFRTDKTLIYAFCGLQANCSIAGTDTAQSQRTLRREALELSLYAFKYLKNVDQVVSLVQTVKDGGTSAIFLRKRDLKPELEHPLRTTLPLKTPPLGGDRREAAVIDALTLRNTFPAHYEALPGGDAILVLDVAAQGGS